MLTDATLAELPVSLGKPSYDRSALTAGIVHFGVGGFHRAHQAMYLDQLMNAGLAHDWAICGVGVLPGDARMKQVMDRQDCLYTLVVKNPDGTREGRVIGSIIEYLFAPDDPEAVIEKMASDAVRIVSLTVTEGGYNFHHVTGDFDADNPDVVHDLQPGAAPRTTFGLVTEALRRRRERGLEPFTVMSCDNIQGNGDVARKMFTAFASLKDPSLGAWVAENVPFPNSMVDRITPVTTDDDRLAIADEFGVEDGWPVVCEPFEQWVLEDHFSLGPPALRKGRRAARGGRGALRADEAAAPQRQPPGHVLLRLPCRLPLRARGGAGPAVRPVPARLHGQGGNPDPAAGPRHRPRHLQAHADRALLQRIRP
jgi:mannitol 2-dehydrogenase